VPVYRKERFYRDAYDNVSESRGFRLVRVGTDNVVVEVEVDLEAIANGLGLKAAKSRHGKSRYMSGAIRVRTIG
jgi:hypothetical protein